MAEQQSRSWRRVVVSTAAWALLPVVVTNAGWGLWAVSDFAQCGRYSSTNDYGESELPGDQTIWIDEERTRTMTFYQVGIHGYYFRTDVVPQEFAAIAPGWLERSWRDDGAALRDRPIGYQSTGWPVRLLRFDWDPAGVASSWDVIASVRPIWFGQFSNAAVLLLLLTATLHGRALVRSAVHAIRRARGQCPNCAYDLRGNVSGVCPECGMAASASSGQRREESGAA